MTLLEIFGLSEDNAQSRVTYFIDADGIDSLDIQDKGESLGVSADMGWLDLNGNVMYRLQGTKDSILKLIQMFGLSSKSLTTGPVKMDPEWEEEPSLPNNSKTQFDFD